MVIALPCVAQFVIVLDVTIVAIALPAMQDDLRFSTTGLGWVITAYTLVFAGGLLAAGRLADRIGRRRTFVAGLVLFAAASLACGLAPSAGFLLAARAVQGLGAALVSPAALALVIAARPEGKPRARALGWWTAAAAGGGAGGWVLGGVLSGLLDWRWVFLVNVPVCVAAALIAPRVLAESRAARLPLDAAGAVLATAALAALVLALSEGDVRVLAAPLVLAAALVAVERRTATPLLDGTLLRNRAVAGPNLAAVVLTATTSPAMFLCILYVQDDLGLSPTAAGLLFPPFNAAVIAGSLAGPRVTAALGERRAMAAGLASVAAGSLALLAIGSPPTLWPGFVLMGAGLGIASVASTAAGSAALAAEDQGLASGLLGTSAQVGTALGLALIVPVAADHYERGFVIAAGVAAAAAAYAATARVRATWRREATCEAGPGRPMR